jgi:hypothetical protein
MAQQLVVPWRPGFARQTAPPLLLQQSLVEVHCWIEVEQEHAPLAVTQLPPQHWLLAVQP